VIAVERALEIVLRHARPLGVEEVALEDALQRVLAADVAADIDMPPFARSMMDGYALRAADTRPAPRVLRVVGQLRAGVAPLRDIAQGEAIQIMTGAPLPAGADAVQQLEKTKPRGGSEVEILTGVDAGQNVAPLGSEVRAGAPVLSRGTRIGPAALAVLATFGKARVSVGRAPSVAVLVTGDELVEAGERPGGAQIRNSNGPAVAAQAALAGARLVRLGVVRDSADALAGAIQRGLASDVLVVSGGVSEGVYDLVEGVLDRLGVEVFFNKVSIKPGAPLVFGKKGATLVFGLPGNPVSAQVTFDVFARAAIQRLQGQEAVSRPRVEVVLEGELRNHSRRAAYLPARARFAAGSLRARPIASRGSADVVAHARANALVILDAERERAAAGERAPALLIDELGEAGDAA
jgi:molybdenum cofactor synthesis domain-containing protein